MADWASLEKGFEIKAEIASPMNNGGGNALTLNVAGAGTPNSTQRDSKPYKCTQCVKAFANNSYLSQHMRIHMGKKPFGPCQYCARMFTQLSHLQQHIRTHTGEKPYKCKDCDKSFSQLSNLQSHSRCHKTAMPFKCASCYKCFNDEQSLLEHIPKHKESKHLKVHICTYCGKSYTQSLYLEKHMAKHADRRDQPLPQQQQQQQRQPPPQQQQQQQQQRKYSAYSDYSPTDNFNALNQQLNASSNGSGLGQSDSGASLRTFQQQMAAAAAIGNLPSNTSANGVSSAVASSTISSTYPSSITNTSQQAAFANSTLSQLDLFQRSFQRENMPNALRNGNNERTLGFNMITPLENIKHFNQSNPTATAAFNNCT